MASGAGLCYCPLLNPSDDYNEKFMQKRYTKTAFSLLALFVLFLGQTTQSFAQVGIQLSEISGTVGDTVTVPVEVDDLTGEGVTSYQFTVSYDATVIDVTGVTTEGTLSADGSLQSNTDLEGEARVAFASDTPLEGSGDLVLLTVALQGVGQSGLSFSDARFFDQAAQDVPVTVIDGTVQSGIAIDLPETAGIIGVDDTVRIPVRIGDTGSENVTSYQFTVSYDPAIINVVDATTEGTVSTDGSLQVNPNLDGQVNVAFASDSAIEGPGDLVILQAEVVAEGTSNLSFGNSFRLFNQAGNEVTTNATEGSLTVAQGARAQIIHNAADPAADPVDVYINGSRVLNDFAFRSATPFLDLPAGVELNVGIAPGDSETAADTLANFPLTLEADQAYTVVANGVLNPSEFADNPDGQDTRFTLFVASDAQEAAANTGSVAFRGVHGSTDAPTVDVISVAGPTLLDDITYGDISGYLTTEPAPAVITVAPGSGGSPVGAFAVDLSGAGGTAFTVLASGFFNPAENQDGPAFTLIAAFADGTVTELNALAFPQDVSVSINQSFGDATDQSNYILAGLPGQVDLPVSNTLEGNNPDDWRVFWDNGASSADQGLVEFDGTDTFNFRPGRGFWMLARNPWSVSQTFSPVSLNADGTASISLHSGWNIISNPFGTAIPWTAVQGANGASQDLWQWNGSFSTSSSFASAQNGEAFYFLNDQGLDELRIPFFLPPGGGAAVAQGKAAGETQTLTLTAYKGDQRASAIRAGFSTNAVQGQDNLDQFAPPSYFESASLSLKNDQIDGEYSALAADYRPSSAESGQEFQLNLTAEPGETVRFEATGLDQFQGQEVRLVNKAHGLSHDLHEDPSVTYRPENKESSFVLLVGSPNFVNQKQSEVIPEQVKLLPNYPNPFRGQTTVSYALPEQSDVRLVIYDILGREVRTLVNDQQQPGLHSVQWDGRNNAGQPVASGLYLSRLVVGEKTQVNKMTLVK